MEQKVKEETSMGSDRQGRQKGVGVSEREQPPRTNRRGSFLFPPKNNMAEPIIQDNVFLITWSLVHPVYPGHGRTDGFSY